VAEKTCTVCRQAKPLSDFSPCRNGVQPSCKQCRNHKAAAKNIPVNVSEQKCRACNAIKPAADFNKAKNRKSGLQSECKRCTNARKAGVNYPVTLETKVCCDCGSEKPAAEFPRDCRRVGGLRKECRDCASIRNRSFVYSLSLEQCREMCDSPACEICGEQFSQTRGVNIDHCHATGAVRGALCNLCNRMLGSARDNPTVLEAAANYLRSFVREGQCG